MCPKSRNHDSQGNKIWELCGCFSATGCFCIAVCCCVHVIFIFNILWSFPASLTIPLSFPLPPSRTHLPAYWKEKGRGKEGVKKKQMKDGREKQRGRNSFVPFWPLLQSCIPSLTSEKLLVCPHALSGTLPNLTHSSIPLMLPCNPHAFFLTHTVPLPSWAYHTFRVWLSCSAVAPGTHLPSPPPSNSSWDLCTSLKCVTHDQAARCWTH